MYMLIDLQKKTTKRKLAISRNWPPDAQTASNSAESLPVQNAEAVIYDLTGKKEFTTARVTWKTQTSCTAMGSSTSKT